MDKIRSEDIRRKLNVQSVLDSVKKKKLQWLGHIFRMDSSTQIKQMVVEGKEIDLRKRGTVVWQIYCRKIGRTWREAKTMAENKK